MKKLMFFTFGLLIGNFAHSQKLKPEIISNGGGLLWNSSVQMTYTIGEPVSGKILNASTVLTQGFQQPWSDNHVSVSEQPEDNCIINVYPNPTKDILNISLQNGNPKPLVIELIDLNGKVLLKQNVSDRSNEKQISLSDYPKGSYFLKIASLAGEQLGTYKIQKIN